MGWSDNDEPHASATDDSRCHRGTRASGPHVEAARRLGLRLPPAATWVREPPARMWKRHAVWGFAATWVRGPPARMWKRHAVWGFGCRPLSPGYAGLRPACGSGTPSGASAAARCHRGTRASGPYVRCTEGKPLSTPSTRHLARASHLPNFHLPRPFRSGRGRGNEDGSALMERGLAAT